jgi:hypothetical protein
MVKKTTKRRIKGGNKKTDILGPFIPQSLYTLKNTEPEKHKLEKLETNYEEKEYETQNKINELRERLNVISKMANNDAKENLNINKFNLIHACLTIFISLLFRIFFFFFEKEIFFGSNNFNLDSRYISIVCKRESKRKEQKIGEGVNRF